MLASTLEGGSLEFRGEELKITVLQPASVIDLMMGAEPRRIANATAGKAVGRPIKVSVISGTPGNGAPAPQTVPDGVSARSRASGDPVVQRMREKFGAEIRTVIDHRDKN